MNCPLLAQPVTDSTCQSCMYRAADGACLHSTVDTTEFARARGVKPSEVDLERVKAEQRIQAGLLLYEYLAWVRLNRYIPELDAPDEVYHLLITTPLADMGVTTDELYALANPSNWTDYCKMAQLDSPFRLAQVLLLTEQQFVLIEMTV